MNFLEPDSGVNGDGAVFGVNLFLSPFAFFVLFQSVEGVENAVGVACAENQTYGARCAV